MKKRFLILLAALCMMCTLLSAFAADEPLVIQPDITKGALYSTLVDRWGEPENGETLGIRYEGFYYGTGLTYASGTKLTSATDPETAPLDTGTTYTVWKATKTTVKVFGHEITTYSAEEVGTFTVPANREIGLQQPGEDGKYTVSMNGYYNASEQRDALRLAILDAVVATVPDGSAREDAVIVYSALGYDLADNSKDTWLNSLMKPDSTVEIRITYPAVGEYEAVSTEKLTIALVESRSTEHTLKDAPYSMVFRRNYDSPSAKAVYEAAISAPAYDPEYCKVEYRLGSTWRAVETSSEVEDFRFGARNPEQIRVTWSSPDRVFTEEFELAIVDNRAEVTIVPAVDTVTVTYGAISAQTVLETFAPQVVREDGTAVADAEVTFTMAADRLEALDAGEHTLTLQYAGSETSKPTSCNVKLVVEKAPCTVTVTSTAMTYTGEPADIPATTDPAGLDTIRIVAGLQLAPGGLGEEQPQVVATKVSLLLSGEKAGIFGDEGLDISLTDLMDMAGFLGIPEETMNTITGVLEQLPAGVQEMQVTLGGKPPRDSGVYLVAAVTIDPNYETAFAFGGLVIAPADSLATLDWVNPLEQGFVTAPALEGGFDLSAQVTAVTAGTVEEAGTGLVDLFVGVGSDGNFLLTQNQSDLTMGAYTQLAFLLKWGNTVYYAQPITRSFLVSPQRLTVCLTADDRDYDGQPHPLTAALFDENGQEITDYAGTLTIRYRGVTYGGDVWDSTDAPTDAGIYAVTAFYEERDAAGALRQAGMDLAVLSIFRADGGLTLEDVSVPFDGEPHFVAPVVPDGVECLTVTVDDGGNVNLCIPQSLQDLTAALEERLGVTFPSQVSLTDLRTALEELTAMAGERLPEGLDDLLARIPDATVTVNGPHPSAVGTYTVCVLTWSANYESALAQATLTITPVPTPDPDPTPTPTPDPTPTPVPPTTVDPAPAQPDKEDDKQQEIHDCDGGDGCPIHGLTDVPAQAWYHTAVDYVVDRGIMQGVENGSFAPDTLLSRAMLMTVLARMDGADTEGGGTWYEKGMAWAVETGVSDGTDATGSITREQAAAMLYRFAQHRGLVVTVEESGLSAYADGTSVSDWALTAMNWAVAQGVMSGRDDGTLDPQGTATRAEIAQMLMNFDQRFA